MSSACGLRLNCIYAVQGTALSQIHNDNFNWIYLMGFSLIYFVLKRCSKTITVYFAIIYVLKLGEQYRPAKIFTTVISFDI